MIESKIGFCRKCGIIREDAIDFGFGSCGEYFIQCVPVVDCPCTAVAYGHAERCRYTVYCGSKVIDMGADEDRDCDCGFIVRPGA